ncbi:MAG TPA: S8 family serine peptidase, partial [Acidimicrobiales bacterium]|nr:S8 family serine peptidase [Acidimicrobiales bacterium]
MITSHPVGSRRRALQLGMTALAVAPLVGGALAPSASAATAPVRSDAAAPAGPGYVTVVAQFAPGTGPGRPSALRAAGLATASVRSASAGRYVVRVPADQAASVIGRLRAQGGTRYVEVATPVHSTGGPAAPPNDTTPNDPCYVQKGCVAFEENGNGQQEPISNPNQQYLQTIGAPAAWKVSKGQNVTVAVLDTGVDAAHEDLAKKVVRQTNVCATDDMCGDSDQSDDNGHGTHVSGILAADTDNNAGVASLGWSVKVDEYKVLNSQGDGDTADVATAIYDAVAAGDRVINMSLANYSCQQSPSDCGPDPDEQAAVEYAIAHNVVVVAAAGNGLGFEPGDNGLTYPASYPGVLSVAATDDNGAVQSFSQWGQAADIAAPGLNIISTWNDGTYWSDSGTSMASPQVAAAAALVISHAPTLTGQQVTEILEASAAPTRGGEPINGGLLDVPAALAAAAHPPSTYLGYDLAGSDGTVYSYGSVGAFGDLSGVHLAKPIVAEALNSNGQGYWLAASDGGVFSFGDARFYGSTGGVQLVKPVVGMASTPDGKGYWMVASDGGVFSFGDARFYGSTGGVALTRPVVGLTA